MPNEWYIGTFQPASAGLDDQRQSAIKLLVPIDQGEHDTFRQAAHKVRK